MVTFDTYAHNYREILKKKLRIFGEEPEYFAKLKVKILRNFMEVIGGLKSPLIIAEIGCGIGELSKQWSLLECDYKNIGLDLSLESLKYAQGIALENKKHFFINGNASFLPFQGEKFDLVCFAGILHHIPLKEQTVVLKESWRVLKKGGLLAIFEHNPYNPLTRWVITQIEFDKDACLISLPTMVQALKQLGFSIGRKQYTTFFPRLFSFLRPLEPKFGWCPLGAQYFIAGVKPG